MENNYSFDLHESCPDFLRIKLENMHCKCNMNAKLQKHILDEAESIYYQCSICSS